MERKGSTCQQNCQELVYDDVVVTYEADCK